jgi:ABC-2 type transport system ATP-binding protein
MNPAIRIDGLVKQFGRTEVLRGIELAVPEGAIYALVGANGAGKTTMIKLLMNILRPTAGGAKMLGIQSRELAGKAFNRIGYVSENQEMPDWMTVGMLLDYMRPFYPAWDLELEKQLVRQFDLPLDRKLKHLSRGMRMKASLASSLAYRPRLLVLDEPFTGLDPLARDEFIEGLVDCAEEATMLISSHDLAEIETFATHIGFLIDGRLRFSQSLTELSGRFREVEITLDESPALPNNWPAAWLQPDASARVVRFVDSNFDNERTANEVRRLFGLAARVHATPMSLRAIFVTLARQSRTAA